MKAQSRLIGKPCDIIKLGAYQDDYCITHHAYLLDCLECGVMFHTGRPHTKYCVNACRQRAYRTRKALYDLAVTS